MTAVVCRGDARALPLPDESVDLVVTSPPYFGLRSYTDGGEHYATQIGAEATPDEYVAALVECTREMARVLKPSGSIFVNLGDKYAGGGQGGNRGGNLGGDFDRTTVAARKVPAGMRAKSLLLLPERYRIACVDELGLIARAVIVWAKPNGLPESVTDRVRRSHEDWVHLTRSPRYFSAVDEIREPHGPQQKGAAGTFKRAHSSHDLVPGQTARQHRDDRPDAPAYSPLGKLPGSVWSVATQPLKVPADLGVDHFAAFPMEWPRRLITGWCPREVCTACGEGRHPVTEKGEHVIGNNGRYAATPYKPDGYGNGQNVKHGHGASSLRTSAPHTVTGYACACPDTSAPATPGIVLDPFGGTGTTALVADVLGRVGISLDASADYTRLAAWRTHDEHERAAAAGNDRAAVTAPTDTCPSLFDVLGGAS